MSVELTRILEQAERLAPDEQLWLIAYLADKARRSLSTPAPRRPWRDIAGVAPYPLVGEDAQAWVSRGRREDEARFNGSAGPGQ